MSSCLVVLGGPKKFIPFPGIRSSNFTKSEKYLNHDGSEKYLEFVLNYLRSEEHVIG